MQILSRFRAEDTTRPVFRLCQRRTTAIRRLGDIIPRFDDAVCLEEVGNLVFHVIRAV